MKMEPQEFYTTIHKDVCLYTSKYLCYEEDVDGVKNWQLFEEDTYEEYWIPESHLKEVPKCTTCGGALKVITTIKGKFWGCRKDGCREYIPIEQYGMTKKQEEFFNRVTEVEGTPHNAEEAQQMARGWK